MLNKLTIKNVALIDFAEIEFKNGFNVLSGETGAGKSVIIESINFVLGAKADKNMIRSGQTECFVCADFCILNNSLAKSVLTDYDIEYDDTLIISRKFNIDGKNTIKLNGNTVNVTMLKKLTSVLIDVHGQSEHYNLLSNVNQLKLLDSYGENDVKIIKDKINIKHQELQKINDFIDSVGGNESQRAIRLDVLNYQIDEIEKASITEDEEDELNNAKTKLIYQEKILSSLSLTKSSITDESGVTDLLYNVLKSMGNISSLDDAYNTLSDRLNSVYAEISDIGDEIGLLIDNFAYSNYSIDYVDERLSLIKNLKKKYGNTIYEIYEFLEKAKIERDNLIKHDELYIKYLNEKKSIEKELYDLYVSLSNERKKYANNFSKNVLNELTSLGMKNANFIIQFNELPSIEDCNFSKNGLDKIEFLFTANLGQPLKPLNSVISGGEISRFMLSIKAQTSKYNEVSTFIFDEIDAGISGETAFIVAQKLCDISKTSQVVAISHLPQISAFADNNLLIKKIEAEGESKTTVSSLSDDQKIDELIRLVGGEVNSNSAKNLAKELVSRAKTYKNN